MDVIIDGEHLTIEQVHLVAREGAQVSISENAKEKVNKCRSFIEELVRRPTARIVGPGPEHLALFETLCRDSGAAGKLVADAQHAAVAIENGCTMVTTDSDYDRFPGLRWQHPLRPSE